MDWNWIHNDDKWFSMYSFFSTNLIKLWENENEKEQLISNRRKKNWTKLSIYIILTKCLIKL